MRGRLRADCGLLVLTAVVVAVTSALLAAVGPLTERTADRAVAEVVRDAGTGGSLVATLPQPAYRGDRDRDPDSVERFAQDVTDAQAAMPLRLAAVVRPGVASLTSSSLDLRGAGTIATLRLAYVQTPTGSPEVAWVDGAGPQASVGPEDAGISLDFDEPPWPVQVGLSERVAGALGVGPGDRLTAVDEYGQPIDVRVTGVYAAARPDDDVWRAAPELLQPSVTLANGIERTAVAALVTPEALPDLRIAVPSDQLAQRISFDPVPDRIGWVDAPVLRREVIGLKAAPGVASDAISWDGLLDRVLDEGLSQVSVARGQAQVLLAGLLAGALLTLVLAAQLLARRRSGSLVLARERGATLLGIGLELAVESVLVAVVGGVVGVGVVAALLGGADLARVLPVLVLAALAPPLLGAARAAQATAARRVPANRAARRLAQRAGRTRRLVLEAAVVALAAVSLVALRQRGAVDGDLTPASAATWWALAGALLLVRALPPLARVALRLARRTAGPVRFVVAARVVEAGVRGLPLLVVAVAVAQLVLSGALAGTERRGQEAGALLSVGADARLTAAPDPSVAEIAAQVAAADGVQDAVAARVDDGVRAVSLQDAVTVRLVVVDARAYQRLLEDTALPDAPQLSRLGAPASDAGVPALLLGGPAGLTDGLKVAWGPDGTIPLDVVGEAPRVGASADPVVVVDSGAFGESGAVADPDTVWVTGSRSAAALREVFGESASVTTYDTVLDQRRDAPLAAALVRLATTTAVLLLLLAGLAIVLGAAADAPVRAGSVGRLRSLGLPDRQVRRVLTGELAVPVVASVLAGLALGVSGALVTFGSLDLEQVTGQAGEPPLVVPLWVLLALLALALTAVVIARRESATLRRTSLARLLRAGDRR